MIVTLKCGCVMRNLGKKDVALVSACANHDIPDRLVIEEHAIRATEREIENEEATLP